MLKIVCDRCGKEISDERNTATVDVLFSGRDRDTSSMRSLELSRKEVDLCPSCAMELLSFLDDGGKKRE